MPMLQKNGKSVAWPLRNNLEVTRLAGVRFIPEDTPDGREVEITRRAVSPLTVRVLRPSSYLGKHDMIEVTSRFLLAL